MTRKTLIASLALGLAASSLPGETFACNLKALTAEQRTRHQKLSRDLATAVTARHELADGYGLEINSAQMPIVNIAEWVTYERRCCPFLAFRIDVPGKNEIVRLALQGAEGVKSFIKTEFHM